MNTYQLKKIKELKEELETEVSETRIIFIKEYIELLEKIAQYNFGRTKEKRI